MEIETKLKVSNGKVTLDELLFPREINGGLLHTRIGTKPRDLSLKYDPTRIYPPIDIYAPFRRITSYGWVDD
ncbi:MAG: hypothetical protein ACTSRU_17485 [Candidatus Hodarchaeales archaeon]